MGLGVSRSGFTPSNSSVDPWMTLEIDEHRAGRLRTSRFVVRDHAAHHADFGLCLTVHATTSIFLHAAIAPAQADRVDGLCPR